MWALAALAVANVVIVCLGYMLFPGHRDPAEAGIAASAFLMLKGQPVYYGFDAPTQVSLLYGPWTYLWHAWPLALFGATLTTSKVAAVSATLLAMVGAWAVGRRHGRMAEAFAVAVAGGLVL